MIDDSLPYDRWIEEALRGVIRRALAHTAEFGLPGAHHFYLTFRTDADGVELAPELRARHPEDMTIVLQHQFWDLEVDGGGLGVTLKFHGKPYRLRIPIAAISAFGDPSVNFGLQLKRIVAGADQTASDERSDALRVGRDAGEAGTGRVVTLDNFRKK